MAQSSQSLSVQDAIILTMLAKEEIAKEDGKAPTIGRTALQKLVYFATLKIPADISYVPHYYGPFSRDVAVELEGLVAIDYLDEKVISTYTHESYLYGLTDDGKMLAEADEKTKDRRYPIIKGIVEKCDKFCELRSDILSYAAKAYYILRRANRHGIESITSSDVKNVGKSFRWNISKADADKGFELLSQLNLVKQQK